MKVIFSRCMAYFLASALATSCGGGGGDAQVSNNTPSSASLIKTTYTKPSNTSGGAQFGYSIAMNAAGDTLVVGAPFESSAATGINGNPSNDCNALTPNNCATDAGAIYVYVHDTQGKWNQQAYIKASNTAPGDQFGYAVAVSADGNTLAVAAIGEDSPATNINGSQTSDCANLSPVNCALNSGAVYIFTRDTLGNWTQQAYIKASNTAEGNLFGSSVALSADGNTLGVGAEHEGSPSTGINNNQTNDCNAPGPGHCALDSGAAYVYIRSAQGTWTQEAYLKASNSVASINFGIAVSLSADGNTLAVGAHNEDCPAIGIHCLSTTLIGDSGAVYVYTRNNQTWSEQAYLKASNPGQFDEFGISLALNAGGDTLAVGAIYEDSAATGINDTNTGQSNNAALDAGAVYLFSRNIQGQWTQEAYIKASNTDANDLFGTSVALSSDGNTLAVGAIGEGSAATTINGDQNNNNASASGAVYFFGRDATKTWSQRYYVKAPNTDKDDNFGFSVALSSSGSTLAAGAALEDSAARGINNTNPGQANNTAVDSGAVYVFAGL